MPGSPWPAGGDDAAPRLIVLGSIHFDLIVRLPRLPRSNDRLTPLEVALCPGGMGGNVAAAFARLGGQSAFAGSFAPDEDGEALRADLVAEGVDVTPARVRRHGRTPQGVVLVGEQGERAVIGSVGDYGRLRRSSGRSVARGRPTRPDEWARRMRDPAAALLREPAAFAAPAAACYCPAVLAPLLSLLPADLPLIIDVEMDHTASWDVDLLRAVLGRAAIVLGNEGSLSEAARRLGYDAADGLAAETDGIVAITRGARGCRVLAGHERGEFTGFMGDSVDTTGAGDCFAAAFSLAVLRGEPVDVAARFANAAAALWVRALGSGTAVPSGEEVCGFLAEAAARAVDGGGIS